MDEWMDDGWMMDGWMMDRWMDGDGWMMDGWIHGWIDGWMYVWMDGMRTYRLMAAESTTTGPPLLAPGFATVVDPPADFDPNKL